MAFDKGRYLSTEWKPRTAEVPIENSNLRLFFPDDEEKPCFVVRSLTYDEIAQCNQAVEANGSLQRLAKLVSSATTPDAAALVEAAMGLTGEVQGDTARRIKQLILGVVEPEIDQQFAVAMAERNPADFALITNKIVQLTGLGQEAQVKQPPSGETSTSSGPASSPTPEEDSSSK